MRLRVNSSLKQFHCRLALVFVSIFMLSLWANQLLHVPWAFSPSACELACKGVEAVTPAIHWSRARLDNRRMLRIYEWVWTGEQWDELTASFDVCLAAQSSLDRVVSIVEVSQNWLGPISLTVYIQVPEEWIILNLFVMYMQRCSAPFAQTVSIHVVVPVNNEPSTHDSSRLADFPLWSTYPCGQPSEFLAIVMEKIVVTGIDSTLPFPQNHMRNVARKTCGTSWVLMVDVDIIPRPNSAQMLQEFYNSPSSNCSRCQFVIPVYEMSRAAKYPESKKQLIEYESKDIARQFWLMRHANSHFSSNQALWAHTNLEEGPIKISHDVDSVTGNYEPFYIGPDDIPAHDERFVGYGFTRPSQVLEALETGWTFKVVTPIFLIHRGFRGPHKDTDLDHFADVKNISTNAKTIWTNLTEAVGSNWTPVRRAQSDKNKILFTEFVAELKARKEIALRRSEKYPQYKSGRFISKG